MAFEILDQANTPHFTTQENLWFIFQEVKKKKKERQGIGASVFESKPCQQHDG